MISLRRRRSRYSVWGYYPRHSARKKRGRDLCLSFWLMSGSLLLACLLFFGSTPYLTRAAPPLQTPEDGEQLFQQQCIACHTIGGGDTVGPDLENVTGRRDSAWLRDFIANPGQMISSGDPIATQLLETYRLPMPDLGLTDGQVEAIIVYLQQASTPEPAITQPEGQPELPAPDQASGRPVARPLEAPQAPSQQPAPVDGDPIVGEQLFTGRMPLAGGGPHCIACHNVANITPGLPLNGGSLGPDLTHVARRLGPGLTTTLGGLAGFPTMQGVYRNRTLTPEEQTHLAAFFQQANQQLAQPPDSGGIWYWGAGAAGTLLLFALMGIFWPRQRISLAERIRTGGTGYDLD